MADIDNYSEINENFNIVKTLLNSIKAQGILNTSDVDRLLSSINTKLEKINTDEDIDMIKIFLSELKQGLEERHGFLISKFASIESVFSELLKNSTGMMKTSEIKELFDIVATNLSVFSREVVAQKETLTDISLRVESLRTDDTSEKNIIKNIAILKPDIERLNNGFNSIVLSLNDNFKTIAKTISAMDKTEDLNKFANAISSIEMSSNTVLSALQMLDKKTSQVEETLSNLVTKNDIESTNHKLFDLSVQNQEVNNSILNLLEKYSKIDNLAEKIDASVNIIAGLKAFLEKIDDKNTTGILEQLPILRNDILDIKNDTEFSEFKVKFEEFVNKIFENENILQSSVSVSNEEIAKLISLIKALDINVNFQNIQASIAGIDATIKTQLEDTSNKLIAIQDANISKVLNDLSLNKTSIEEKLKDSNLQLSLTVSEKLTTLFENIDNVKKILTQLDDDTLSVNNAIFANITDRLSVFENSLKEALLHHENSISGTSVQFLEQLESLKNLSGVLEYKMDSSRNDLDGAKNSFNELKQSIDNLLSQDVISIVNEIKYTLKNADENNIQNIEEIKQILSSNNKDVKQDLQLSYSKLLEIKNLYNDLKEMVDVSGTSSKNHFDGIIRSADSIKDNFNNKLEFLKADLFEKLNEFKNDFSCSYADSIKEFGFTVENSGVKSAQEISSLIDDLKILVKNIVDADNNSRELAIDKFTTILSEIKQSVDNTGNKQTEFLSEKMEILVQNADSLKSIISKTDNTIDEDMTRQLSIIESNFETLISQITILFEKLNVNTENKLEQNFSHFTSETHKNLIDNFETYKSNISDGINELKMITNNRSDLITETLLSSDSSIRTLVKEEIEKNSQKIEYFIQEIQKLLDEDNASCVKNFESLKEQLTEFFNSLKSQNENLLTELVTKISEYAEKTNLDINLLQQNIFAKNDELKSDLKYSENNILAETDAIKKGLASSNNKADELQNLINTNSNDLYSQLEDFKNSSRENLSENITDVKQFISDKYDITNETSQDILTKISDIIDIDTQINNTVSDIKEITTESQQSISEIKESLEREFTEISTFKNNAENNASEIKSLITNSAEITENYGKQLNAQSVEILDKNKTLEISLSEVKDLITNTKEQIDNVDFNLSEQHSDILDASTKTENYVKEIIDRLSNFEEKASEQYSANFNSSANIENILEEISKQIILEKQSIETYHEFTKEILTTELENISNSITNGSNEISNKVLEEFELLKNEQQENIVGLTSQIKDLLEEKIENYTETIKSSIEINTNNSDILEKIDNFKSETILYLEKNLANINKMLSCESFTTTISDYKTANEILIQSLSDNINDRFESFVNNISNDFTNVQLDLEKLNQNIDNQFDSLKEDNFTNIQADLEKLNQNIDSQFDSLKEDNFTNIQADLEKLNQNIDNQFDSLKEDNFTNIQADLEKLNQNIDNQFDSLKESNHFDLLSEQIEQLNNTLVESLDTKFEEFVNQNNTTDVLNEFTKNIKSDISNAIGVFSDTHDISELREEIENIKQELSLELQNNLTDLNHEELSDILTQVQNIKDTLENFSQNDNSQDSVQIDLATEKIENHINVFNKTIVETITDKYEEIKLLSNKYNNACNDIRSDINDTLEKFLSVKDDCTSEIISLKNSIIDYNNTCENKIDELIDSFTDLKLQIENINIPEMPDFSVKDELSDLQSLLNEQFNYVQDISNLCQANLPEITDLTSSLKTSVADAIKSFSLKLEEQDLATTFEQGLKLLKADLIKQFLNLFNQISFVTEQEEILDFVQEKHEELISVLSHIVTNTETIATLDNKITTVKNDIQNLNQKINSIISSEDSVDYVYNLQDIESDITNLRIVLKEIQDENRNNKDVEKLLNSTNNVYKLVESLKADLPQKDIFTEINNGIESLKTNLPEKEAFEEINKGIENISEDILSISSRTNKLLLSSDESYKTLQDNLQGFRLVIDDLDERTRNFAKESGMDKIDLKLNVINDVVQNGAKSNQVFNQVFEYLAEWVDKAGNQINVISDKIETLDDIGQIKVLLADLKSEFLNNREMTVLIESIDSIYEKQLKKISALETKLDKLIVENTINNKQKSIDLSPIEDTFNKFLVAIDEKMSLNQSKIEKLEKQLEKVMSSAKDTDLSQFTKKIASMDKQLSKLNKSVEKITQNDK